MTYLLSTVSIDRDTFGNTSEDELEEPSVPDQVLGFLAANEDRVFKTRELVSMHTACNSLRGQQ